MLFTAVNEIRIRFPEADLYYLPLDYFREGCFENMQDYRFRFVIDERAGEDFPAKFGPLQYFLRRLSIQKILYRANKKGEVLPLGRLWDQMDVLVDISGYALTSRFGISSINRVLRMLRTAKAHGLKTILLPQSFGPFDFPEDVCRRIGSALSETDLLFVREEDGIRELRENCKVTNAVLSPDIVIQSKEIEWKNVFTREPSVQYPVLKTAGNVGIVPNTETVKNGREDFVLDTYREIIKSLRAGGKEVFIFRHSDDLVLCEKIYKMVEDDSHCHLIREEIDCLSYSPFIRQFDFIVASRFHSIVHAYREGVPALVLGWAVKYQELTALLGQEDYAFDLTSGSKDDISLICRGLNRLMNRYREESDLIRIRVEELRMNSCFDLCSQILDTL